jgi:uncharacterized SAM-binding protein YcdF (DUF218 family)
MVFAIKYIYTWVLPPAIFVLLLIWLACRTWRKSRQLSGLAWLIAALLYAVSIQPVAELLLRPLEYYHPLPFQATGDSILLLGGGTLADVPTPEGWQGQVADAPAQRLIGAYALHRRNGWPILISGGEVFRGDGTEAEVMRDILVSMGMAPDKIISEARSQNTKQNAEFSAEILKQKGLKQPVLVTSAFHMRRSVAEFKRAGVAVTPYPVGYYATRGNYWNALSWTPTFSALRGSGLAIKEYLGLAALAFGR